MATLNNDFCTIVHEGETDHFIRAILEIPIVGIAEPFLWGVWVSLSEKSFNRYRETYESPVAGEGFFGWVCNEIKVYPCSKPRPADVIVQPSPNRPKVVLHRADTEDDPLVIDQTHRISVTRAQELAERARHAG